MNSKQIAEASKIVKNVEDNTRPFSKIQVELNDIHKDSADLVLTYDGIQHFYILDAEGKTLRHSQLVVSLYDVQRAKEALTSQQ